MPAEAARCIVTLATRDDLAFALALRERLDALGLRWPLVCGCLDERALHTTGAFSHPAFIAADASGERPFLEAVQAAPQGAAVLLCDPRVDFQAQPRALLDIPRGSPATIFGSGGGTIRAAFAGTPEGREALRRFATGQRIEDAHHEPQPSAKPWQATEDQPLDFTGARLVMGRFLVAEHTASRPLTLNLLTRRTLPWAAVIVRLAESVRRADPDHDAVPKTPEWLGPEHVIFAPQTPPTPLLEVPQLAVAAEGATIYLPASMPGADKAIAAADAGQAWPVRPGGPPRDLAPARAALEAGDPEAALRQYNAALGQNRHDREAFAGFAAALEAQGNDQALIDACLFHLDSAPDDRRAWEALNAARARDLDRELATCETDDTGYQPREFLATALVSTYDSAEFMAECLTDLTTQTIADQLEIIVVDAASPGDERAIVRDFQSRHSTIRYLRTQARIGIYRAWNLALRAATGTYCTPFSTNDRLAPDAYQTLAQYLDQHPEIDLVFGDTHLTDHPHQTFGDFTPSTHSEGKWAWPGYWFTYNLASCTGGPHPMFRRQAVDRFGYFDERYKALSDQDFFLRLGREGRVRHIPVFTGLAWLSKSALSDESKTQTELLEIRSRFQASYAANACALAIHNNLITNLDSLIAHKGPAAAKAYYALHRRRLDSNPLAADLDKLLNP